MYKEYELIPELEEILYKETRINNNHNETSSTISDISKSLYLSRRKQLLQLPHFIRWVQRSLNKIFGLNIPADGKINPETQNAIRNFQKKRGLKPDGILKFAAKKALLAINAVPVPEHLLLKKYTLGPLMLNKNVSAKRLRSSMQSISRESPPVPMSSTVSAAAAAASVIIPLGGDVNWRMEPGWESRVQSPFGDDATYNKPPWIPQRFRVRQSLKNPFGDELIFAEFDVQYHVNGHAVGFLRVSPRSHDAYFLGSLTVEQTVNPDPNTYEIGGNKPVAMIELNFVYNFHIAFAIGDNDSVWKVTYRLFGDGHMGIKNEWTQGGDGWMNKPYQQIHDKAKPITQ